MSIELLCQVLIITTLISVYPLRLLRYINPLNPWKRPYLVGIPAVFDPAPLFYPPAITMLVSMLVMVSNPTELLPSIMLSIASLPRELIPSVGGLEGSNTTHWVLTCLPLLISTSKGSLLDPDGSHNDQIKISREVLVLLAPLHQALCVTLHYLTTTSLLPAELQLLSIALIDLMLLASSPQTVILKSLLWGGGVGVLVSCAFVLKWGVALARVPKWRFRHASYSKQRGIGSTIPFGKALLGKGTAIIDSGDEDDDLVEQRTTRRRIPPLKISIKENAARAISTFMESGSVSAIDTVSDKLPHSNGYAQMNRENSSPGQRRHTMSTFNSKYLRSSQMTPSGRRKRAASSSVQSFFHLTQYQATWRKWLYAAYVYSCILILILGGIREYVQRYALKGDEPVGWALGYLFGDLPWFRMEVVSNNLQRWICIPPRSSFENEESCHLGWVEHLRHAYFGEANTRLILCGYWLAIIIVGLAIVFRLSSIYEVDTRRKVFHFMMVAMLLPATYVDPTFAAMALSLMLAIFLLLDLFRASQLPPLSKSLAYFLTPYVDGRDLKGPVVISHIFLLIGCAIPLWLSLGTLPRTGTAHLIGWEVPMREVSMVSGVICVGMGDAAASLIGRRYGRRKWIWGGGKSIEGSVAFATAVGLALVMAKAWLKIGGWMANNDDTWDTTVTKSAVAAMIASLTEAVLTGGNDNVVCPIVLWLCVKGLDI
jgi:dolichol kinase